MSLLNLLRRLPLTSFQAYLTRADKHSAQPNIGWALFYLLPVVSITVLAWGIEHRQIHLAVDNKATRRRGDAEKKDSRNQRSDDRGQTTAGRTQRSEVRGQRSEVRGQRSDIRDQRSEFKLQMTDDSKPRRYPLLVIRYSGVCSCEL